MAHPWLRSYPAGIDWDAPLKAEPVYQILEDAVTKWPDRPAIEFMQRKFSYRELGALVDRAANGFRALGVAPEVMSASIFRTHHTL